MWSNTFQLGHKKALKSYKIYSYRKIIYKVFKNLSTTKDRFLRHKKPSTTEYINIHTEKTHKRLLEKRNRSLSAPRFEIDFKVCFVSGFY